MVNMISCLILLRSSLSLNSSRYLTAVRQASFVRLRSLELTFDYACHFGFKIVLDTVFALLHRSAHSNRHLVILVTSGSR